MTDKELKTLFRRIGSDLDARQRAQLARLRQAERELFAFIISRLQDTLTIQDGRIVSRASEARIARAVQSAINEANAGPLKEVHLSAIKDLLWSMRANAGYYQSIYAEEGKTGFGETKAKVIARLSKRLGIEGGTLVKGGYLQRHLATRDLASPITQAINSAIVGKRLFSELTRQLEVVIKGTKSLDGSVTRQYAELIRDTYHKTDREASDQFGAALKFKWFSYEGGLIETSRKFCIKRDGQVFNSVEAEKWRNDPTLPRTTKERESGVITDYVPTRDLGRWNCRHRVRWISEQMARRIATYRFN